MSRPTADQLDQFARELGGVLRGHRATRGLTRKSLLSTMDVELSQQTLAKWECGARAIGVARLVQVCHALDVAPAAVLGQAHAEVFGTDVRVDLGRLARTTVTALLPLRPWAALRAGDLDELRLDGHAVDSMAAFCGLDPAELARLLLAA